MKLWIDECLSPTLVPLQQPQRRRDQPGGHDGVLADQLDEGEGVWGPQGHRCPQVTLAYIDDSLGALNGVVRLALDRCQEEGDPGDRIARLAA